MRRNNKCEILAEANKKKAILEAEAQAEAITMKGDAEAYAVEMKAKAEAEQMAMKAEALKDYRRAAKVDLWMETLPRIAAEVAAPMSQCEKVSMVMDLGSDPGTDGPSKLTQEVMDIMTRIPESVAASTGVSLQRITA